MFCQSHPVLKMPDFAQEVERSLAHVRGPRPERSGTLVRLVGLRLEARGIMAPGGSCCEILGPAGLRVEAEVVGFSEKTLYLMPFTEPVGIGPGALVRVIADNGHANLGPELLGRVIDGRGEPLDGRHDDVAGFLLRGDLGVLLYLVDDDLGVVLGLVLETLDDEFLGFLGGQA